MDYSSSKWIKWLEYLRSTKVEHYSKSDKKSIVLTLFCSFASLRALRRSSKLRQWRPSLEGPASSLVGDWADDVDESISSPGIPLSRIGGDWSGVSASWNWNIDCIKKYIKKVLLIYSNIIKFFNDIYDTESMKN